LERQKTRYRAASDVHDRGNLPERPAGHPELLGPEPNEYRLVRRPTRAGRLSINRRSSGRMRSAPTV
jgi:hypothetical protein